MNRDYSESAQASGSAAGSTKNRELYITSDFRSIPAGELRALCGGFPQWVSAVFRYKLLRSSSTPAYALELRRFTQVEAANVTKRLLKHFAATEKKLAKHNFSRSFYANIPALGPHSSAVMGMSQEEGEIHFCALQVARKISDSVVDESHFGFFTWLRDGVCLATLSPLSLPRLDPEIDLVIDRSDDPAAVLKTHRNRLLKINPQPVTLAELFEKVEAGFRRQIDDLIRRQVIRPASAAEVARIRNEMRV